MAARAFAIVLVTTATAGVGTGAGPRVLSGHEQDVLTVTFSPDGRRLATTAQDRTLRIWNPADGTSVVIDFKYAVSRGVAFSPDGKLVASRFQNKVGLWSTETGAAVAELAFDSAADGAAARVAFSPDGKLLAVGHERGLVRLWDSTTRKPVFESADPGWKKKNSDRLHSLVFSPDGRTLLVGYDDEVQVWNVADRAVVRTILIGHGLTTRVTFLPDGRRFCADVTGGLHTWDVTTGKLVDSVTQGDRPRLVAPVTDDTLFGSAERGNGVSCVLGLFGRKTGKAEGEPLAESRFPVTAVAVSADGKTAAYTSAKSVYLLMLPAVK